MIYLSKRQFTAETQPEATRSKLVYDFSALFLATRLWYA